MTMQTRDRRRSKRRNIVHFLSVFQRHTNEFLGVLVDISPEGGMLTSELPFPVDTFLELRMFLPRKDENPAHLDFDAQACWCRRSINPCLFDTGLQLIDISEKNLDKINELINCYGR